MGSLLLAAGVFGLVLIMYGTLFIQDFFYKLGSIGIGILLIVSVIPGFKKLKNAKFG